MSLSEQNTKLLVRFMSGVSRERVGPMDLRDYNRRAAEALKAALSICSEAPSLSGAQRSELSRSAPDEPLNPPPQLGDSDAER